MFRQRFIPTSSRRVQRPHVENVDALHLSENFQTLETGGLFEVGRDSTGGGTGANQVLFGPDLCKFISSQQMRRLFVLSVGR